MMAMPRMQHPLVVSEHLLLLGAVLAALSTFVADGIASHNLSCFGLALQPHSYRVCQFEHILGKSNALDNPLCCYSHVPLVAAVG